MSPEESHLPIFIGVSRRAARRHFELDLLGLTTVIPFPYFPQPLTGLQCVFGFDRRTFTIAGTYSYKLFLIDETQPANHASSNLSLRIESREVEGKLTVPNCFSVIPPIANESPPVEWGLLSEGGVPGSVEVVPTPAPPLRIERPCRVIVEFEHNGKRHRRGEFVCALVTPPPLTAEEQRAISSRPGAANVVLIDVTCKLCKNKSDYFCQLDQSAPKPRGLLPECISIYQAPDIWICSCGKTKFELNYLKQGIHDVFRHSHLHSTDGFPMSFTPLYEAGRIQSILAEYEHLIDRASDEETVQKHLEEHSVFWAFLSPAKILHKPSVLTKRKADFGILTTRGIFYLVEIEKPTTKLTNQDDSIRRNPTWR